jgi:hypothetical protein
MAMIHIGSSDPPLKITNAPDVAETWTTGYHEPRLAHSPVISGPATWAGTRHTQIGLTQAPHSPKICVPCLTREALWAVLGPLL